MGLVLAAIDDNDVSMICFNPEYQEEVAYLYASRRVLVMASPF